MKTKYKFIHFKELEIIKGTKYWYCLNNKSGISLGRIVFHYLWKQYVVNFNDDAIFNNQCLLDIVDFLNQLSKKGKPK